jgi:hypothetical protein
VRLAVPLAFALLLTACSTKAKLAPAGGECLQATDCEPGLVCIPQTDGRRLCDNNLSSVQHTEDAEPPPQDAGPRDATRDGHPGDGAASDAEPDTGPSPGDAAAD